MAAGDAFLLTSQFAAAGLFLLLACVLLAVRFNSRVNRAFAILLLLRGANLLFLAFARWQGADAAVYDSLIVTARYFAMATPFALAYFAAIYLHPQGGFTVRAVGVLAILAVVVFDLTYLVDHCTVQCPENSVAGPLIVVVQAVPLSEAMVGLVLVSAARKLHGQAREQATTIVAAAFTLLALLESSPILASLATNGWAAFKSSFELNAWIVIARLASLVAFVVATVAIFLLTAAQETFRRRALVLGGAAVMVATALYLTASESSHQSTSQTITTTTFLFGVWRLLAASLVAYALVRHRFLDLDLRINWTISRGTVLAILIATFLVVSKIIENALNSKLGVIFGGVATGLLMLAIKPLERLGDRVANGVHPRGRRQRKSLEAEQRLAIFREQATLVWSDGHIGRKERLLLDSLREQLGLDAAAAASIEHDAAAQSPFSSNAQALSTQS